MIAVMDTAVLCGFGATKVSVEVDISRGLPAFHMVGLAENSVKEARVRVQSSIVHAGFDFPKSKIFVNLAPADLQKSGTSFDLAIALAILSAAGVISPDKLEGIAAIGELSLNGRIRPVRGMLALAESIKEQGFKTLLVSKENAREAGLIKFLRVKIISSFAEMMSAILSDTVHLLPEDPASANDGILEPCLDMSDVVGQEEARRALLIAAAGDHNLLFVGGPGSGKSMMAHRLPSILPTLSNEEALILTKIYSLAGFTLHGKLLDKRPFRSPHHSTTRAGLIGGGSKYIRPGEISLACFGVLFLDELLEFPRAVLEVLREPLEDGKITLSRATSSVTFPAQISMIAALNPCPCGYWGQNNKPCICAKTSIERYQSRLSGPLVDRIDLHVNVPPVDLRLMNTEGTGESSQSMREKVTRARARQKARFSYLLTNGKMSRREIREKALVKNNAFSFLLKCGDKLGISARSFDRIIKVARTIADLDESLEIDEPHIAEALHFRPSAFNRS